MFTIEPDNNITYHENAPDLNLYQTGTFPVETKEGLAAYCKLMSRAQCQELYNSLPGAPAVRRLRNIPYAIYRIWAVMQTLVPRADPQLPKDWGKLDQTISQGVGDTAEAPKKQPRKRAAKPQVAPGPDSATRRATADKNGHREPPKEGTRQAQVLAMLNRKKGLTVAELGEKFGWQAHTCRGLLSTINANGWAAVTSAKNKAGERVYRAG